MWSPPTMPRKHAYSFVRFAAATAGAAITGTSFAATKAKADKVESPIIAVQLWEKFIDAKPAPSPADLEAAKAELANWQKLQKDKAERINGKWVGGEEKRKL